MTREELNALIEKSAEEYYQKWMCGDKPSYRDGANLLAEPLLKALEALEATKLHYEHPYKDNVWAIYLYEAHTKTLSEIKEMLGEL